MEKIRVIENKYTPSLETARPPFYAYAGWSDGVAVKLGNITRHAAVPPKNQQEAAREWHNWYNEAPRATYLLGRRASILAFATFEEAALVTDEVMASHMFNLQVYTDVDRDALKYFCHAIHEDHNTWSGATWIELHPDGNTDTTLFATLDYQRIPIENRIIMTRNT